jgi:hypothetical protein
MSLALNEPILKVLPSSLPTKKYQLPTKTPVALKENSIPSSNNAQIR